jgi:Carbohydrate esterase, sialic acid-specific acetylesterase
MKEFKCKIVSRTNRKYSCSQLRREEERGRQMRRLIPALFLFSSLFLLFTFLSIYPVPLSLPFPFSALFPPPNAGVHKHVFILAGQSNMAGRGPLSSDNLYDQYVPHLSVLRLNRWLHWETAREPMHYDIDVNKTCGVGPGLVFAKTVLQKGEYLSTLDQWILQIAVLICSLYAPMM